MSWPREKRWRRFCGNESLAHRPCPRRRTRYPGSSCTCRLAIGTGIRRLRLRLIERNVVVSSSEFKNKHIPLRLVFSLMIVTMGGLLAAFLAFAGTRYGFKWPGL